LSWTIEELTSLEIIVICGFGLVCYFLWCIRQELFFLNSENHKETIEKLREIRDRK